jgi:hypothetical protein
VSLNSGEAFAVRMINEDQRPLDARTRTLLTESAPLMEHWSTDRKNVCASKKRWHGGMGRRTIDPAMPITAHGITAHVDSFRSVLLRNPLPGDSATHRTSPPADGGSRCAAGKHAAGLVLGAADRSAGNTPGVARGNFCHLSADLSMEIVVWRGHDCPQESSARILRVFCEGPAGLCSTASAQSPRIHLQTAAPELSEHPACRLKVAPRR